MEDLTGRQFGELTVIEYIGDYKWKCRCSCGEERVIPRNNLISGNSTSCGHNSSKDQLINLTGEQFGELTVIRYDKELKKWLCKCSCGKEVYKRSWDLRYNKAKTCGDREKHNSTRLIDITGHTFGELTAIKYLGCHEWLCNCSCGKEGIVVTSNRLRNKEKTSCGHDMNRIKLNDLTGKKVGNLYVEKYLNYGKYECTCDCGNKRVVSSTSLLNKSIYQCEECTKNRIQKMYDDIRIDLLGKKFGDLTVIGYEQSEHKWVCECSCGNVVKVYGQHLRVGDTKSCGCRYGLRNSAFRSYIEMEIYKFIKDNFTGKIVTNNRGILSNNKEIDIYIPDLKVGIEVNGDYWHNDEHVEINYHKNKVIEALAKGVRLIHIYEHEWVSSQECIKYLLLNILNKSEVVYARNTIVKEIDKETAKTFLNENHLQGYVNSSINIALYENNNLLAVMTFDKPRFNRREEYEIIRLSYRKGINIVGGTEKMFKYFLDKYKPNSIITYASMDKFTGDVYKRLKFNNIGETKPGYVWSRDGIVLSRYKTMKKNLINKGLGTEEQTEDSIMKSMNYNKIYNSGNKTFIWNKNNNKGD